MWLGAEVTVGPKWLGPRCLGPRWLGPRWLGAEVSVNHSPHRIGLGSGTGPLYYEFRDPVQDPEALPFKYFFGQVSVYI